MNLIAKRGIANALRGQKNIPSAIGRHCTRLVTGTTSSTEDPLAVWWLYGSETEGECQNECCQVIEFHGVELRRDTMIFASGDDLLDQMPMHIRQPALDAIVIIAELFVIESE